ncbi:MAG: hypothetical protein BroJett026_11860 [Betaproteobacteria bacterium]|nr:MAG: hypothetical protein BroJett026_11860 [Betaproteobacteria bacterium]
MSPASNSPRPHRDGSAAALAVVFAGFAALAPLAATAQPAGIDPQATALLKASTDFLARQQAFSADTRNTLEVVLASGQKIQFDHTARLTVRRPDKLRAERTGDLVAQSFYYDGKTLTLLNADTKHYATVAAPGTIEAMLDYARATLDLVTPAGDLVYRNAYDILMTDVTQGFVVGKGVIEGVRCDHLAFRAPHVDLEIWIQEGSQPLPRKLVITSRDVTSAPQFSVVATRWNLQPVLTARTFAFSPPAGAKKIEFLPVGGR